MKRLSPESLVFILLLLLALAPIWSVSFFVTGDGPCHLYNSKILLDWYRGDALEFYKPFYFLNQSLDPNWLTNLLQVPLLMIFPPPLAERLFFSLYILLFAGGFRFLVLQINPGARFVSAIAILFAWNHIVMMGFCNNALSIALWFWVLGTWWKLKDSTNFVALAGLGLLFFALYLAHPIGLVFMGLSVLAMLLGGFVFQVKTEHWRSALRNLLQRGSKVFLLNLPGLILFGHFVLKREWRAEASPELLKILSNLVRLSSLITLNHQEVGLAIAIALGCGFLFLLGIYLRIKDWRWKESDGLLLFVGLALIFTLFPPSSLSGGLEVQVRMVMIPYLAVLMWISTATFPRWSQYLSLGFAVVLMGGLLAVRLPSHRAASDYAAEVYSLRYQIPERSRVLVLNYDWTGHTLQGAPIADRIWLFTHVDTYLGAQSSLVLSDNYEANFWYFPMIAHWQTNMYSQTDKDGINFDHRPPRADILSYARRTGQDIDFVLLLSPDQEKQRHPYTQEIQEQLSQAYSNIARSEHGRAVLYKKR